jgi:hypothetical protein
MTTMLEKMAEAMVNEMGNQNVAMNGTAESLCVDGFLDVRAVARAALLAIREADRSILNRGADAAMSSVPEMSQHDCNVDPDMMQAGLAAMIDSILNEQAPGERNEAGT